jgi:hypothetical protein
MLVVDFIQLMRTMVNTLFLSLLLSCFSSLAFSIDEPEKLTHIHVPLPPEEILIQKEDATNRFLDKFESSQPLPNFDEERNTYAQMIITENTFDLTTKPRKDSFIKFWPHLRCLNWITTIRLQNTGLTNFNDESLFQGIEALSCLTTFDVSGNLLRHLPATLPQLKHLKKLILKDNQFLTLNIKSENLEELNVSGNILSEMCLHTPRLNRLDISRNTTFKLTEAFFEKLTHLTFLNMSFLFSEKIPESIGLLINLTDLDISLNYLSCLPENLTKLSKLEKLNASRNNSTSTKKLENFPSLLHLDLSYMSIQTAPILSISCRYIDLSHTQISNNPYPLTVTFIYTNTPLWDILHTSRYDDIYSDEVESDSDEDGEYRSTNEEEDDFS